MGRGVEREEEEREGKGEDEGGEVGGVVGMVRGVGETVVGKGAEREGEGGAGDAVKEAGAMVAGNAAGGTAEVGILADGRNDMKPGVCWRSVLKCARRQKLKTRQAPGRARPQTE